MKIVNNILKITHAPFESDRLGVTCSLQPPLLTVNDHRGILLRGRIHVVMDLSKGGQCIATDEGRIENIVGYRKTVWMAEESNKKPGADRSLRRTIAQGSND